MNMYSWLWFQDIYCQLFMINSFQDPSLTYAEDAISGLICHFVSHSDITDSTTPHGLMTRIGFSF